MSRFSYLIKISLLCFVYSSCFFFKSGVCQGQQCVDLNATMCQYWSSYQSTYCNSGAYLNGLPMTYYCCASCSRYTSQSTVVTATASTTTSRSTSSSTSSARTTTTSFNLANLSTNCVDRNISVCSYWASYMGGVYCNSQNAFVGGQSLYSSCRYSCGCVLYTCGYC